jgi:hypothetical protein
MAAPRGRELAEHLPCEISSIKELGGSHAYRGGSDLG